METTTFVGKTRAQILESFDYVIVDRAPYFVASIKGEPEAFTVVCKSREEAEREAYDFLRNEVDDSMYDLPDFAN